MKSHSKLYVFIFLLALINTASAQRQIIYNKELINNPQTKFVNLKVSNGLSNAKITDIIQDSHGLMWIATVDGLNSYNGSDFTHYFHVDGDSNSLLSSHISCIEEVGKGILFIGTDKGLCTIDLSDNKIHHIKLQGSFYNNHKPNIRQIKAKSENEIWVDVLDGNLLLYDLDKDSVIINIKHKEVTQPYYYYNPLYYDSDSVLWFGGRSLAPMFLEQGSHEYQTIYSDKNDPDKKRESDVACFYEDSESRFWVTALDGIYLMDRQTQIFKKFMRTSTWDVIEDNDNNIWFATGSGIMKYNTGSDEVFIFMKEKDNPHGLLSNSVSCIWKDYHNNLWFGTNEGISIYSPPAYPFGSYSHISGIENSPQGMTVTAAEEDDKGNIWLGYQEEGLDYFNTTTKSFSNIKKSANGLAANEISNLYFDDNKKLWIGLWRGIGFNILDTKSKKFKLFRWDKETVTQDWYSDFIEDNLGNIYIGFWGGPGFVPFSRSEQAFLPSLKRRFENLSNSRLITRFVKDTKGDIWFTTTNGGIYIYYPDKDTSKAYVVGSEYSRGLISNANEDICIDNEENIWILGNSLQRYIPENDSFISYGPEYGLNSKSLISLLPDNIGNIWVASEDKGLFRFNIEDEEFVNFTVKDGLQSNKFSKGRLKLSTGELLFGGNNGFNLFSPGHIFNQNILPTPYFGRFSINGINTHTNLNDIYSFIFNPDDLIINLELNSTDAVNPERYYYQCMLKGYDNTWVEVDSRLREIRYSRVPAGIYEFSYRIGDGERWSEDVAKIIFKFSEPFYKRWWFYSLIGLALLIITIAIIKQRIYDLNQKHKNLELQQKLFRLQMNPHFMFNSLLAIQNFVFKNDVKEAGTYISDFAKLFRLILENSQNEFIAFDKELETIELYLKLQTLRYGDKFSYEVLVDDKIEQEMLMIPPMLAQPMIENAIEHGIIPKQGIGKMSIKFRKFEKTVFFEVIDDGVGFNSLNTKKANDHKSSALTITKERLNMLAKKFNFIVIFNIEELKGQDSKPIGTKVSFHLPYTYFTDINNIK